MPKYFIIKFIGAFLLAFLVGVGIWYFTAEILTTAKANKLPGGAFGSGMTIWMCFKHPIFMPATVAGCLSGHFFMVYWSTM